MRVTKHFKFETLQEREWAIQWLLECDLTEDEDEITDAPDYLLAYNVEKLWHNGLQGFLKEQLIAKLEDSATEKVLPSKSWWYSVRPPKSISFKKQRRR